MKIIIKKYIIYLAEMFQNIKQLNDELHVLNQFNVRIMADQFQNIRQFNDELHVLNHIIIICIFGRLVPKHQTI